MSYADEIRALLAKKEAMKQRIRNELQARQSGVSPGQVPITAPPGSAAAMTVPQKKAGWGWAFLIVGGGLFVFWGIPLFQGKGAYKPGMSKPPGYAPTRNSPEE
jgi:hypothetical protein